MKDKLSVGMFIRTPLGIDKIIYLRIQDEYGCNFDTQLKHNLFLNNERDNISIDGECFEKEEIKANYNIIDILEEGDYVNGYKVSFKDNDYKPFVQCDYPVQEGTTNHYRFYEEAIYSIVTHEQMEQMAYKVGE